MFAIAQIKYRKLEDNPSQHLTFQTAHHTLMKYPYNGNIQTNVYWDYNRFSNLLLGKGDGDYSFYLILE